MKKLIKRIVPILLSVFMLFGALGTPVYASQSDEEEEPVLEPVPNAEGNSDGDNTEEEGSQDLSGKDGAFVQRSGFIIYVSDSSMNLATKPPVLASSIDLSSIARHSAFRLAFIIPLYSASESITIFSFLGLDIINVSPLKTLSHKLLKLSLTSMLFTANI